MCIVTVQKARAWTTGLRLTLLSHCRVKQCLIWGRAANICTTVRQSRLFRTSVTHNEPGYYRKLCGLRLKFGHRIGACGLWKELCAVRQAQVEGTAGKCGIVILHFEKLQKAPDTSQEFMNTMQCSILPVACQFTPPEWLFTPKT